jgi:hypothetical protein
VTDITPPVDEIANLMDFLIKKGSHQASAKPRPIHANDARYYRPMTQPGLWAESNRETGSLFDDLPEQHPSVQRDLPTIQRIVGIQFQNLGMNRTAVENHFVVAQAKIQEARLLADAGLSPAYKSSLIQTAIRIARDAITHLEEELTRHDGRTEPTGTV